MSTPQRPSVPSTVLESGDRRTFPAEEMLLTKESGASMDKKSKDATGGWVTGQWPVATFAGEDGPKQQRGDIGSGDG
ncbi:hypothetical protein CCUS01_09464 [Colletotrichum cuscutae]|uniref:Uncharacterized protein n=1 Tax=Colletotrichum cuscutae TaxID=1209917 RepID=A0AAI9UJ86_9PEZI|nr:hypothetical protein CCUS01_09464 [Colletotrichum cuscutae]